MNQLNKFAIAVVLASIVLPGAALAQAYKWRDEKGQIVYSDQPPPKSIPPGNILQAPKPSAAALAAAAAASTSGAAVSAPAGKVAASPPKSIAEREADYKKRQIETQKKSKEDADKATAEQQRVATCEGLRGTLAGLESGNRIRRTDASGTPVVLNDDDRASEITKIRGQMTTAKCG